MEKIYTLSAVELNKKFINGELSAVEIVQAFIDRIENVEKKVNALVNIRKEKALIEAKKLDEKRKNGEKLGSLAGVPIVIKDNMLMDGEKITACSKILENYIGIYDSTVVKKLKESDAIILAIANMDEFAFGSTTKTSFHHMTSNPYDLKRVPGGSSGGSAASVAALESPLALGSDTGGSIRQPSSFCGTVGLKPTYGRVSRYGLIAFASSLDCIGPIAKNVEDVALCMNVISGSDEYDSTVSKKIVPDYMQFLNKDIKGMKIGLAKEYFIDGLNEQCKKEIEKAIEVLKSMGAEIVEISLPHTKYSVPTYYVLAPAEASSNLARFDGVRYGYRSKNSKTLDDLYINSRTEGFGDEVKRRIIIGTYVLSAGFYDAYFKKAQKVRRLIREDFDKAFKSVDVILSPVSPSYAFKLNDKKSPIELYLEDIYTIPANLAGVPAISVPTALIDVEDKKLPIGIQFIGNHFEEEKLIQVADAFFKNNSKISFANLDDKE